MSEAPSGNMPTRILVVDSNVREVVATLAGELQSHGWEVRTATDWASALEIAHEYLPQLVLIDLSLPRLQGFHLARQFRQLEPRRTVWLVAGSPFGDTSFRTLAKDAGFDDFVLRPYTASRCREFIENYLHLHSQAIGSQA